MFSFDVTNENAPPTYWLLGALIIAVGLCIPHMFGVPLGPVEVWTPIMFVGQAICILGLGVASIGPYSVHRLL